MDRLNTIGTARTQSETIFETYCTEKQIAWERIEECAGRTPDYELKILSQTIVVEVKEIAPNDEEVESDRVLAERGYGNILSCTPGDRVRKKINDSSAQIKARATGKHPSLLVLFDRGRSYGHLDPYHIRVAMYGLERVHIALPPLGTAPPYTTGMGYGPKRKMTQEHNTSISAIGVLCIPGPNQLALFVYHNKFAAVPLPIDVFRTYGSDQFMLGDEELGLTAKWIEIPAYRSTT